jgi:predicted nuclease of predicted toxin-antitoxin system
MRFLVDENLPKSLARVLLERGHDAVHATDIGLSGAKDEAVWERAASENRVLVTRDLDFPLTAIPRPSGLVLMRLPNSFGRRQIRTMMEEFLETDALESVPDRITVLSPGRVRARAFE